MAISFVSSDKAKPTIDECSYIVNEVLIYEVSITDTLSLCISKYVLSESMYPSWSLWRTFWRDCINPTDVYNMQVAFQHALYEWTVSHKYIG